ncbi:MAG: AAA family ATPase [bacterium]|nr:AAA family ATPase [bacterium]
MKSQWLSAFGLQRSPFAKDVSDTDLWLPSSRTEIVDEIVDGVSDQGHVLLVGEPGVGKTCVLRAVRHRLPEAGFRLSYCHNATLGRRDFYRQLCHALGLSPKATAASVFYAVSTHVQELGREQIHPAFLLDEAHLLHQDVLDHLHILCNYDWDSNPLLSLVLVGLPELWDRLVLRRNRSLWSRIHTRLNLGEALPEDTVEYVRHRLDKAGVKKKEIFTSDALAMLHEATAGHLRDLDRVATAALKRGARRKLRTIDRGVIQDVLADQTAHA